MSKPTVSADLEAISARLAEFERMYAKVRLFLFECPCVRIEFALYARACAL